MAGVTPEAPLFGMDPAMTQAYAAQMFAQYLQQMQAYAAYSMDPAAGLAGTTGVPQGPLPCMGSAPPYNLAAPTARVISVSVEGMKFQYQLTQDDLHKVFSRYGAVTSIQVDEAGTSAHIAFQDFQSAQAAMTDLNGKVLNGLDGTLRLVWASQGPANPLPPLPLVPPPLPGWGFPAPPAQALLGAGTVGMPGALPGAPGDLASMLAMGVAAGTAPMAAPDTAAAGPCSVDGAALAGAATTAAAVAAAATAVPMGAGDAASSLNPGTAACTASGGSGGEAKTGPAHVKGVKKYTCRFLIGIENDKEFQVVRRIIGAKGTNMKRIVRQTETPPGSAGAKLRLRGVGSGYFEGAGQRESSEPLQLCVSCTSSEGYRIAVKLVEELLESVYVEYRQFCRETGRPEANLHAAPQLVSGGGRGGGSGSNAAGATIGCDTAGGGGPGACSNFCEGDGDAEPGEDDDEGEAPGSKREGRRRGRRSRTKRGDAAKSGMALAEQGEVPPKAPPVEEIERLIDARNEARRQCNFTEADRIRQNLHERGVALMDEPGARGKGAEVTTWRYWREFESKDGR